MTNQSVISDRSQLVTVLSVVWFISRLQYLEQHENALSISFSHVLRSARGVRKLPH